MLRTLAGKHQLSTNSIVFVYTYTYSVKLHFVLGADGTEGLIKQWHELKEYLLIQFNP